MLLNDSGAAAADGGSSAGTLGALDLGGSSLEVTFAAESVPWEEDAGAVFFLCVCVCGSCVVGCCGCAGLPLLFGPRPRR